MSVPKHRLKYKTTDKVNNNFTHLFLLTNNMEKQSLSDEPAVRMQLHRRKAAFTSGYIVHFMDISAESLSKHGLLFMTQTDPIIFKSSILYTYNTHTHTHISFYGIKISIIVHGVWVGRY